jgi:hypothetical protein
MQLDPSRKAEIERVVRAVYATVLEAEDRGNELDDEFVEIAIDQQVALLLLDSLLKNRVLLTEYGKAVYARAFGLLSYCLGEMNLQDPYREEPVH